MWLRCVGLFDFVCTDIVYCMCYLFLPRTAARPQECMRHTKPIDFKISIAAPREATCCQPDSHTLVAKIARRQEGSMRMERALNFAATKETPLWTATWATMALNSQAAASAVIPSSASWSGSTKSHFGCYLKNIFFSSVAHIPRSADVIDAPTPTFVVLCTLFKSCWNASKTPRPLCIRHIWLEWEALH